MKTKKLAAWLLAAVMCLSSFTACGKSDNESTSSSGTEQSSSSDNSSAEESTSPPERNDEIRDISSVELVKEMSVGWNLGNTMDSTGTSGLEAETAWQGYTTTTQMAALLKESGFDVMRVPVTWFEHMDSDGNIDKAWLDRVQEIVDYGIDNGLFVILNTHHEDWLENEKLGYGTLDELKGKLANVWEQLSERFKGYDEHLIFEGMNEPRKKGTPIEWTGGDKETRDCINQLNMVFVETVRNSGGNNAKRHLMLPTYAASSTPAALDAWQLPENDDKIIVSVHAYLPYDFALNTSGTASWSIDNSSDTQAIDNLFADLEEYFLSRDIAVIIGEFGNMNKFTSETETGDNREARAACAEYYVSKAKEYGVPCVWWDNNAFVGNGENFGLMTRDFMPSWKFPDIVKALTGKDVS